MKLTFRLFALLIALSLGTGIMEAQTALKSGSYYIQNVATGQYLTSGANNGYRCILGDHGVEFKVTVSSGNYKLTTDLNQSGRVLKSSDGYMDGENETWKIEAQDDGTYTMYSASKSAYFSYDPTDAHPAIVRFLSSKTSPNARWRFWTRAALLETMATATKDAPVDASFLMTAPDFLRGDQRIYTDHCWGGDLTGLNGNKSSSSYLTNSHNAEQRDKASFNITQTLTGIPNGLYKLSVQGFYRYSTLPTPFLSGSEELLVQLYAGAKSIPLKSIYAEAAQKQSTGFNLQVTNIGYVPNDQAQAAQCFTDGAYVNVLEDIFVSDNTLTLGVRKEGKAVSGDWTCFDNFTLLYYGNDLTSVIDAALLTWNEYAAKTVAGGDDATYQTTMQQLKAQIENAEDAQAINAAVAAVKSAYQAYCSSPAVTGLPLNLTFLLENADFKAGTQGWTVEAAKPANVTFLQTSAPAVAEAFAGASALELRSYSILQSQPVTLSPGYYRLSAYAFYRYGPAYNSDRTNPRTYAALVAGDHRQDVMRLGDLELSAYPATLAEAAASFSTGNYHNALYFRIEESTTLNIGFEGTHRSTQSWFVAGPMTLEKVVENQTLEYYSVRWDAFRQIAEQALDHSAFDAVLQQALQSVTDDEFQAADAQVYAAFCSLLQTGTTASGLFDLTAYIRNATFDAGTEGWQATGELRWADSGCAESYNQKENVISQVLKDMPAGHYTLKLQAFYRTADTSSANDAYEAGTDAVTAQLFLGQDAVDIKNINDESRYITASPGNDTSGAFQRKIPHSTTGASAAFAQGQYWNMVSTDLDADGDLTFGLRQSKGKTANWLPFDNFRLYYGTALPTVTLSTTEPYTLTEDTRANVRTDIALKAGAYNQVCLPFELSPSQVAQTFTAAYTLGGVDSDGTALHGQLVPATTMHAGEAYFVQVGEDCTLAADDVLLRAVRPDSVPVIWDGAATEGSYDGYRFNINLPREYNKLASTLTLTPIDFNDVAFTTNLENWRIRRYLTNTYTQESATVFANYLDSPPAHRDQPHSVFIPVPDAAQPLTLTVTDASGATALTKSYVAGTTLCEVPNLIPQQDYTYRVEADGAVLTQGRFRTEGRLRMIKANSGSNIRDLGGWLTAEGFRTRYGLVYRGGELNAEHVMNSADIRELRRLGIMAEVDLREDKDVNNQPFTKSALGADALYTYENLSRWDVDALTSDTEKFKDAFNLIMKALRDDRAVYFHCIWGADRTGCLAFLLEGLLGLTIDQLYKDYELTSYSIAGYRVKNQLDSKINYINAMPGTTLQKKFFHYWNKEVGISVSDLAEFIDRMVDGESSLTHAPLAFDAASGAYFQNTAAVPMTCSLGSTAVADAKATLQRVGEEGTTDVALTTDGIYVRFADIALEPSNQYKLTVPAGAILDAAGTPNEKSLTLSFRTPQFFDGEFYLYMPTLSKFISRGAKWSTRITADNYGVPVFIATDQQNVTTVRCQDSNRYFGSDCYTDKSADFNTIGWALQRYGKNYYVLKSANAGYLTMTADGSSTLDGATTSDAIRFNMISRAERDSIVEVIQQNNIKAALKAAGYRVLSWAACQTALDKLEPTGASVTIPNAKSGNKDVWVLTEPDYAQAVTPTEYNVGNYGGELFQRCGTISQTVEVPRAGLYQLSLTAFFREGPADRCYALGQQGYNLSNAYVSVNNTYFAPIPSWYSECTDATAPSTAAAARTMMNAGKYKMSVLAYIPKKATITVHVPGYVSDGWCVFNNFTLREMVEKPVDGVERLSATPSAVGEGSVYNLAGQRLSRPSRGIYIIRGRKVAF